MPGTSNVFRVSSARESIWAEVMTWEVEVNEIANKKIIPVMEKESFFMFDDLIAMVLGFKCKVFSPLQAAFTSSSLFTFFLDKKSNKKVKAEKITSLFCQAAIFNGCTTVPSTFDLYC